MATYKIRMMSFEIANTRAVHNDTDYVSFALKVGDRIFPARAEKVGDLNDGWYPLNWEFVFDIDDPGTPIVFSYLIINSGHSDTDVSTNRMAAAANGLCSALAAPTGGWSLVVAGGIDALLPVVDLFVADCDGWVAGDQISINGAMLAQWTAGGPHQERRFYPGVTSNAFCGGNSEYYVTWDVSVWPFGWSKWHSLGGQIIGEPAVFSRRPDVCDVFVQGTDHLLWAKTYVGSQGWGDWYTHNDGFRLGSSPVLDSMYPDHLHWFVRGEDGKLWQRGWTNEGGLGPWTSHDVLVQGSPGARSRRPTVTDVFVRGMDNGVWHKWYSEGGWSNWTPDETGFQAGSSPVVDSMNPDHLHWFVRGADGQLWQRWWTAQGGGSGWVCHEGQIIGAPGVRSRYPTVTDVFVRGTDNGLWQKSWVHDHWTEWYADKDGFILGSSPVADSMAPGHLHIFARGADGQLYQKWFVG